MTNFKSLPFQNFIYSHTHLNNYIKISTAAIDYLYNSKQNSDELSDDINKLILAAGERWTPRIIKNPTLELSQLKNDLSKTGIIWVYSYFDVFFKQIEGQLSGFFSNSTETTEKTTDDDEEDDEEKRESKIISLYHKLGWSTDKIKGILPVFKFYIILRHCVAHNVGRPSEKLVSMSKHKDFIDAIENWETKYTKKKISNPPTITYEEIELKPHHAIMYSEACLRIATDINEKIFEKFGINHYIGLTIRTHLSFPSKLTVPHCSNFSRYIAYHLKNDYQIAIPKYDDIYGYYNGNEVQIKQDKQRYLTLKNNC